MMLPDDSNLNNAAANLFGIPKKNVYRVPEGFFNELELDIRKKYPQPKRNIYRRLKRWAKLSVAAAVAAFLVFSGVKTILHKEYQPVETDRGIYTLQDGNQVGE